MRFCVFTRLSLPLCVCRAQPVVVVVPVFVITVINKGLINSADKCGCWYVVLNINNNTYTRMHTCTHAHTHARTHTLHAIMLVYFSTIQRYMYTLYSIQCQKNVCRCKPTAINVLPVMWLQNRSVSYITHTTLHTPTYANVHIGSSQLW